LQIQTINTRLYVCLHKIYRWTYLCLIKHIMRMHIVGTRWLWVAARST